MKSLFKKPIVIIWMVLLFLSLVLLLSKGLHYGVDLSGGTVFQIMLEQPVSQEDLARAASVVAKRIDWSGSMDVKVTPSGDQYLIAQLAESDPGKIEEIKSTLLRQGKFEAVMDGNILFYGDDIKSIFKDSSKGYGIQVVDKKNGVYNWTLPFLLSPEAAANFAEMTFHKCTATGFSSSGNSNDDYDCEKTYFFVDRPIDTIIVMDKELYLEEKDVPVSPEVLNAETMSIDEIIAQISTNYYVVDNNLTDDQFEKIKQDLNKYTKAIVASTVSDAVRSDLEKMGFKIIIKEKPDYQPWIWEATGLKSIISLTPGVANMDAPTINSPRFKKYSELTITGSVQSQQFANKRLNDLLLVLESGSLPIPIDNISTESISPYLGSEFLNNSLLIGILALITVAIVLFVRYRVFLLSFPIFLTGFSEIIILLGFISLINFRMDLAAVAGILATIGTGVDHQVIITDELVKGKGHEDHQESFINKIKRAFFIVFTSAATVMATMLPIIFFSGGLSKLVGFAVTIVVGSIIGILITRPTYAEVAKQIITTRQDHHRVTESNNPEQEQK